MALDTVSILMPVRMMPATTAKLSKRPEISQVIGFCVRHHDLYSKTKYYHQIQIKKKTNNNHNQVVHNITP